MVTINKINYGLENYDISKHIEMVLADYDVEEIAI
jgi:hypothetical protein